MAFTVQHLGIVRLECSLGNGEPVPVSVFYQPVIEQDRIEYEGFGRYPQLRKQHLDGIMSMSGGFRSSEILELGSRASFTSIHADGSIWRWMHHGMWIAMDSRLAANQVQRVALV